MLEEKDWLSVDDVAQKLSLNPETIRRWIRAGKLKAVRAGRQHRIRPKDLDAFLEGEINRGAA